MGSLDLGTVALVQDILAWIIPLVVCYFIWPVLRRRRAYIVAAAVLCLTPMWVNYQWMANNLTIWPLVLCLPVYLDLTAPGSLKGLLYMALPGGLVVGTLAWFISGRIVRPTKG